MLRLYIIWHSYSSIADSRFPGFVYHSKVLYILEIRNGLPSNYITKTEKYIASNNKS